MNHIGYEQLYHLAELTVEDEPFSEDEVEEMRHIGDCKECYSKFCALVSLMDVTSESGYLILRDMYGYKETNDSTEYAKDTDDSTVYTSENVWAIIEVAFQKAKDSAASMWMKQIGKIRSGLRFENPLAVAVRGDLNAGSTSVQKLEEIENEYTFIAYDPVSHELLIQIDTDELELEPKQLKICIKLESGEIIDLPITKMGTIASGKMEHVPDMPFHIVIERVE
jgi:hypothetical protein